MLGACKTYTQNSIFASKSTFVEAKDAEPEPMEDEKDEGVIISQPKKSTWLPGERLDWS